MNDQMEINTVILVLFVLLLAYPYGRRTVSSVRAWSELPATEPAESDATAVGDRIVVSGTLTVESAVADASLLVSESEPAVGVLYWRAGDSEAWVTPDDPMWDHQRWRTFASGIEYGALAISTGNETVRIDPSWFDTVAGSTPLPELSLNPIHFSVFKTHVWDRPELFCRTETVRGSVARLAAGPYDFDDQVDPDSYLFEASVLRTGMSISVVGELQESATDLVIGGSDAQPLYISDQGFDTHRQWLARRGLKNGVVVGGTAIAVSGLLLEIYWPVFCVLVVTGLVFLYQVGLYATHWVSHRLSTGQ